MRGLGADAGDPTASPGHAGAAADDRRRDAVNTTTADTQQAPRIAVAADGHYVVVWQSDKQDGSKLGVYARVFNADGSARSGEILVNTTTTDDQTRAGGGDRRAAAASSSPGRATTRRKLTARTSMRAASPPTAARCRRRSASTDDAGDQTGGGGGDRRAGNVVIAYSPRARTTPTARKASTRRRADIALSTIGSEFGVNTTTADAQTAPAVARNARPAASSIVWRAPGQDGSGIGVYGQRFTTAGGEGSAASSGSTAPPPATRSRRRSR